MKYIKGLDTVRAFAVTIVLFGNWGLPEHLGTTGARLFNGLVPNPKFGVDLFFVLSGFLITSILMKANEGGGKNILVWNFIARRTLRIFPIYYIAILTLVLLGNPFVREHVGWFLSYTANFLFYKQQDWSSFGHTWSLSVEEQFYLVWPWLIVFVNPRHIKYVLYLSIFVGLTTTVYIAEIKMPVNMYGLLLTPTCMQAFGFSADGGHLNYWYRAMDSVISIWLIHYTITMRQNWIKKNILENRILVKIGRVSYGVYCTTTISPGCLPG